VKVTLPKGSQNDISTAAPRSLAVAILADGRTIVGGTVVSLDELKTKLTQAHDTSAETTVIVQADSGVSHGKVVEVTELARGVGLEHIAIATQAPP